ncbi:hypothetical protein BU25DRAFT_156462 [Macroventuria anomochaeta]|uniref:Uncharacterized protein n=1 Tax=Macroventuria anomochaeta TaxID=301207 RepID=A0ACB6RSE3_9PLEO|nr:uncharacterized protein BU25DRAFT_156462 [Macroventuria anomochaeta]KAF2624617.1 hypothetical protein BU25DRAFT_156462 [Macroventuria anomochaeta]
MRIAAHQPTIAPHVLQARSRISHALVKSGEVELDRTMVKSGVRHRSFGGNIVWMLINIRLLIVYCLLLALHQFCLCALLFSASTDFSIVPSCMLWRLLLLQSCICRGACR